MMSCQVHWFDDTPIGLVVTLKGITSNTRGTVFMNVRHMLITVNQLDSMVYTWETPSPADPEANLSAANLAILDTRRWSWSHPKLTGPPPCARVGHSLAPLPTADGGGVGLALFGGRAEGEVALNDLHMLTPRSGGGGGGSGGGRRRHKAGQKEEDEA